MSNTRHNKFGHVNTKFGKDKNKFVEPRPGYNDIYPAFSFKHFDLKHKSYSHKAITRINEYYLMIEHLAKMSEYKWKDIKNSHQFHAHEIDWCKSSEPIGFNKYPDIVKNTPSFQFKIFKEARMIGFFNESNIFEIVWLDRSHQVCPDRKR